MSDLLDDLLAQQPKPTQPDTDPLDDMLGGVVKARVSTAMRAAGNPDQVGQANVLAREHGIPPIIVEQNLPTFQRQAQISKNASLISSYPAIGRWAGDPRNAAVAADDFSALGKLAESVGTRVTRDRADFAKDSGFFERMGDLFKRGVYNLDQGAASFRGALKDWSAENPLPWTSEENLVKARTAAAQDRALAQVYGKTSSARIAGEVNWSDVKKKATIGNIGRYVIDQGMTSIPGMAVAALGLPLYIASQTGSIGQQRAQNDGRTDAEIGDVGAALPAATVSALLERAGIEGIFGAPGKQVATRILQAAGAEGGTEFLQSGVEYAGGTVGTKKGFEWSQALEQGFAGAIAGAGMGGAFRGAIEIAKPTLRATVGKIAQADAGLADATVLDRAVEAATESKTRTRDPEAFAALLRQVGEDGDVSTVYVPAEAMQAYMQTADYDGAFDSFRDAVDEALLTGGDIVVPFETAVSTFAGTKAWDALKDDVRLSAGGMSRREATTVSEAMGDVMAELSDQFAEQEAAGQVERAPREALLQSLTDKLMNAGFTPSTARQQAELLTQRAAARTARMGQDLTGAEYNDLTIQQVLPERIAAAQKADQMDIVINAMRGGSVAKKRGMGLTEWIRKAGGIEDRGGDLAAMGIGPIKGVSKKGQMKLLREYLPGQASMLGADGQQNSNSPDELAMRAWEAGYFPEFAERPSVNDLLEAISEAVAGRDRYANDAGTDVEAEAQRAVDDAATELRALLEQVGVDPGTATQREIKEAVDRYAREQAGGTSFDQAASVDSPAFKAWFGDSKAVDAKGKPLVVYHGTNSDFEAFDPASRGSQTRDADASQGYFFSASPDVASQYAQLGTGPENVVPVYLSLQNPMIEDAEGAPYIRDYFMDVMEQAAEAGHDGVIFKNVEDGVTAGHLSETFVAFHPEQIKSSVGNSGTFDPNDPRILYQSFSDGPRGRITFPATGYRTGPSVIDLFQSRDSSTFLHETGHLWLEELRFDASDPNAPDQLKSDWQAVQDWFAENGHAIGEDGAIPVDAHELWARGIERYLMEGKAPAPSLRKMFEAFKAWLVQVYRMVDRLKTPINDDIRDVMARLIATDEEIAAAREEQSLQTAFTEKPATMTDAEWADYQTLATTARDAARDTLLAKVMAAVKRRVTKEYKDREAIVREEVADEIGNRPEFRAQAAAKATPIDSQWLRDRYGAEVTGMMPAFSMKNGGANPDDIAELVGFASGDEMVRALMGLETRRRELKEGGDKRSVREGLIQEETKARMLARYGDPFTDGSIEEEALAAVHNEKQGELIAADLRILARTTNKRATPYSVAKAWAARTVRDGLVRDMTSRAAIQRYRRAANLAGKKAINAILDGMDDDAFKAKQSQMLNNALVDEATRAADEVDKAVARLSKVAAKRTMPSVDQDYLERAQALLEQVDLKPRSQRFLDRQDSFEAWTQEQQAAGYDIAVPPSFAASLGTTNWSRLTVDQIIGLDTAVEQIMHLGRLKQTLIDNKERRDFDEVRGEALDQMGGMDRKPPSNLMEPSRWDGIKSRIASSDAALLKMETVFDWLDQGKAEGVFNRIVFRPITEAQHQEQALMREYVSKVEVLTRSLPKDVVKRWRDKFTDARLLNSKTGDPYVMTRDQLVAIALNMGNAGNRDKLAGGYGWDADAVMAVLNDNLTADEWQYVQSLWDTIDTLWPRIEAMEKRLNGVAPDKIEALPISTSAGVLAGGYYPVVYDPAKNIDSELNAAKSGDLFENIYTRANTSRGFTKQRTKVERPIWLNIGVIERHLSEVIHDLTHREAIMQADKFLSDKQIAAAVDETLGPDVRRQFRPWLQHIANEWAYDRAGMGAAEKFLRAMRRNTTFVGMAFRASTVLMQVAGYSDSAGTIGGKAMLRGMTTFARNPKAAIDFVLERSGEVRARMDTLDRDIRDIARKHAGEKKVLSAAQQFGFIGIGWADRLVVVPTWIGAYNKALETGASEADAVYAADKAVRGSQGAGAAKDLAAIQRGRGPSGEAYKLLTMFYSYASGYYQRMRSLGRDVKRANASDIPGLMARSFWLIIVPALASQALAGRLPDEDKEESWAGWAFQNIALSMANPIPILRDVLPPAIAAALDKPSFGYSFTPVAKAGETFVSVVRDVGNIVEGDDTKRATRNFLEATGYVTGAVPGQVAAAAQFLVDVGYGEADPETIGQWWEGLTKGKIKDE